MRPDIRHFEDYRIYLRVYLQWLGEQDKKFSLRWVAKRAEFASPSMLSMILSGQRILPREKISTLVAALKLLPDEEEYLRLIYELQHAEDPKEKSRLAKVLQQNHRGGFFQDPDEAGYEVFTKWYLPAMRELVAVKDFRNDPFWIASKLGITPFEARDGLRILVKTGLIAFEDGTYVRRVPSVQPSKPNSKVRIDEFNRQFAERALDAISLPSEKLYFNALTVAVSKSTFKKIPEILARLIAEVDMLAESESDRDDVAVLNVQFYSLTCNQTIKTAIENPLLANNQSGQPLEGDIG